jgi:UDP-N-acetylmuramoyl-tripeptide--D-alanyl-D-alanine ligase
MTFEQLYTRFRELKTIVTDSRKIVSNCIFWALKGENFDANDFVEEVLGKGAALVISSRKDLEDNPKIYYTEDTLLCLQDLAKHHRLQLKAKILGITGTNGKTTTKELIHAVFATACKVKSTQGNLNNHIGVPLTLLSFDEDTDFGVVEMGANHPGEIEFLCNIALPDMGIITNIGLAHLEGFGSIGNIFDTKEALFRAVNKREGILFVNFDDYRISHAEIRKGVRYGTNPYYCDFLFEIVEKTTLATIRIPKFNITIKSNLVGNYNCYNIAAAVCIGSSITIPIDRIKDAIENYFPSNNRSQLIKTERNNVIMDAYNANPSSMEAALDNFNASGNAEIVMEAYNLNPSENMLGAMEAINQIERIKKVLILGDMLELGEYADQEHQQIVKKITDFDCESSFLVGSVFFKLQNSISEHKNIHFFQTVESLKEYLIINQLKEKNILVKGSHGIHLEKILDIL